MPQKSIYETTIIDNRTNVEKSIARLYYSPGGATPSIDWNQVYSKKLTKSRTTYRRRSGTKSTLRCIILSVPRSPNFICLAKVSELTWRTNSWDSLLGLHDDVVSYIKLVFINNFFYICNSCRTQQTPNLVTRYLHYFHRVVILATRLRDRKEVAYSLSPIDARLKSRRFRHVSRIRFWHRSRRWFSLKLSMLHVRVCPLPYLSSQPSL